MKLYGSLSQLVAAIFRKDSNNITLRPNQSVTYNADRDVQLPEENANSVLVSKTSPDILTNKSISGSSNTLSNIPNSALAGSIDATKISSGSVDNTEFDYLNGVTSPIQTQLGGKAASGANSDITSLSGLTTALSTSQGGTGVNSTATFPSSGVVVTEAGSATLTNKTIDGDNNTVQDLGLSSLKTVLADANKAVLRDAAGAVTSALIADVNISAAAAIADTKLATISTAGKVANSATTATDTNTNNAIVARGPTGGFSAGSISATGLGVSGNLTTNNFEATGQSLMKFAYINGSTGTGFIEMEGQQVGDIAAPTSGEARLFAGTDGKIYVRKAGSSQAEELGAGGSGEINLVDNSSDAGNWGVVNATATTNTTAANNPLSGTIDTSIAIASSTSGGYARYRFSMPSALKQRKLKLEWYQIASSLTSGAYKVEVWTNAASDYSGAYTELSLSTDSSGTSSIPNLNGKYSTTFDTNGSDYYEIRIVRTAASAATIYIANVVCGPGIQPQGAVVGEWQSYTPTFEGLGTPTQTAGRYRRVGDSIQVEFTVTSGTNTAVLLNTIVPLSLNWDSTKLMNNANVGKFNTGQAPLSGGVLAFTSQGTTKLSLVADSASILSGSNGTAWPNGTTFSGTFTVPIAEWAGSGTVQLAQNDVTYYYGTGGTWGTTATVTTGQGPGGVLGGTTTPAGTFFNWTIVPTSPIQVGSVAVLETSPDGKNWSVGTNTQLTSTVEALRYDGTNWIGAGAQVNSSGNVVAFFGKYSFGIAGAWSSVGTWYWRVKVVAPGAAVGFGIVQPGTSAGLVSASGLPGNITGNAIASGYVGEVRQSSITTATSMPGSGLFFDATSLTLTPGTWLLDGTIVYIRNGATVSDNSVLIAFLVASGNVNTGNRAPINYLDTGNGTYPSSFSRIPTRLTAVVRYDGSTLTFSDGSTLSTATGVVYLKGYSFSYSAATPLYQCNFIATRIA